MLVFEDEAEVGLGRRVGPGRRLTRNLDRDFHAPLEQRGSAERLSRGGDAFVGDEAGGLRAGEGELVGEKAVEPFRDRDEDAERGRVVAGHGAGAAPASFVCS